MKRTALTLLILLILLVLPAGAPPSLANRSDGYTLARWTIDGGGVTFSTSEGYTLGSTAGQPEAATWAGGRYSLGGGFWGAMSILEEYGIYLPLVLRGS